ncbi:MAG: hypothetical protein ACP5HU_05625 [Phycisphaerae bacterium]
MPVRTFLSAVVAVILIAAVLTLTAAEADSPRDPQPVTVVAYDFDDPEARPAPSHAHPRVQAGLFMQPGFFPPVNAFFDGSRGAAEGEAAVDGSWPEYYEFTVEGTDVFDRLGELRFNVVTRARHASAAYNISVELVEDAGRTRSKLPFDFYDHGRDPAADEPAETGVTTVSIGEPGQYLGHVGQTGTIVIDLAEVPPDRVRTFRITFEARSHRSGAGVDNVELTALQVGQ